VAGLGPATLENLCTFIYNDLKGALPNIHRIKIERPASGDTCCLLPNES
jgi:6-pyruvoyltetrahydropterin/6-carboxytetrahydropterin synthase